MAITKYPTALLKSGLDDHEKRIGSLEQGGVKRDERIGELQKDMCSIENKMKEFENWRMDINQIITKIDTFVGIGKWIVSGFGLSIIALIWAIITNQATIIFK